MTFSVSTLAKSLETMPANEREALESKLLADYARHAAFMRPLGTAGFSKLFAVSPGMEELSLAGDADVTSVATQEEFAQAMAESNKPLLLIRSGAKLSQAFMSDALAQSPYVKTVFIVQ